MASTKLIVLKSKEIIYTVIFLGLVALFIIILTIMFKKPATGFRNCFFEYRFRNNGAFL